MLITKKMTTPKKVGKEPRPVWECSNFADFEKQLLLSLGGSRWQGKISFFEDIEAQVNELKDSGLWTPENALKSRSEWLSSKIERRQEWAEKREERSNQCYERSRVLSEPFAMGQPILVGHHSEKGARRLQKRVHQAMDKCLENSKMARHHSGIAESHSYMIKKLNNSPRYYANKLKKLKHRVNQLEAWKEGRCYIRKSAYQGENARIPDAQTIEKYDGEISSLKIEIEFCEKQIKDMTGEVASYEKGDYVLCYGQWCEIVRVNKTTVTAKYKWSDTHTAEQKIDKARIKEVKKGGQNEKQ